MFRRGDTVSIQEIKDRFKPLFQKVNTITQFPSTTTGQYVVDSTFTSMLPNVAAEEYFASSEIEEHTSDNFGIVGCEGYACDFLEYFQQRWEAING